MTEDEPHLTLVIDFDQTLTADDGYNPYPPLGEEVPDGEIINWVNEMHEHHRILVYTARTSDLEEPTRKWLDAHGVKYDELRLNKPKAAVYVDDKAIRPDEVKNWRNGVLLSGMGTGGVFSRLIDRLRG